MKKTIKNNWNFKQNPRKEINIYPSEILMRILLSSKKYLGIKLNIFNKNFKVLELGSFYGNNIRFFFR